MKGLYKKISDTELLFAQEEIIYPSGLNIHVAQFTESNKEINGWRLFENRQEALNYYDINEITDI